MRALVTTLALASLLAAPSASTTPANSGVVALKAGTIYTVENGEVIEDGVVLIRDGRIAAVGSDVNVPAGAHVVDYGADAVIAPGLVAAYSVYGQGSPARRTAAPGLRAVDGFDFFAPYNVALMGGVTSTYITPAEGRMIAGSGAVVKLSGDDHEARILRSEATIHAAIDWSARRTPGQTRAGGSSGR